MIAFNGQFPVRSVPERINPHPPLPCGQENGGGRRGHGERAGARARVNPRERGAHRRLSTNESVHPRVQPSAPTRRTRTEKRVVRPRFSFAYRSPRLAGATTDRGDVVVPGGVTESFEQSPASRRRFTRVCVARGSLGVRRRRGFVAFFNGEHERRRSRLGQTRTGANAQRSSGRRTR